MVRPVLQRGQQFAVVNVEHLGRDAQQLRRLLHLGRAALRQRSARDLPVADVAVGDRDELDVMPERRPLGGHARRLELGIVGMRAEANDAQLAVGVFSAGRGGRSRESGQHGEQQRPIGNTKNHDATPGCLNRAQRGTF